MLFGVFSTTSTLRHWRGKGGICSNTSLRPCLRMGNCHLELSGSPVAQFLRIFARKWRGCLTDQPGEMRQRLSCPICLRGRARSLIMLFSSRLSMLLATGMRARYARRAVAITAISQYCAIDEHNRRGMQQPQQPRYFLFFLVRLRPSSFILSAYVLNISNDNNVYHADLYRGSVNLHLTSLNRQGMRERSTDRV